MYACSLFKYKHAIDRLDFIKSRNLCLVCFNKGYDYIVCGKKISCRIYNDKNSTYVHVSDNHSSATTNNNRLSSQSQGAISNFFISNVKDTTSSNTCITIHAATTAKTCRQLVHQIVLIRKWWTLFSEDGKIVS